MTQPQEVWQLDTRRIGRRVHVYPLVDSTNTLAAHLSQDPGCDGHAVLAHEQRAGRGQHGRAWLAAPRSSVLLSLALRPPEHLRRPALLTAWAAVAVCSAARELTGWPARIKWPNDVLLRGRKVCGILIEQGQGIVVGIGLNVRQTAEELAGAGLVEATSLQQHTPDPLDPEQAARVLLRHLDDVYALLLEGDLQTLECSWKWHLGLLGRDVRAEVATGTLQGRLRDAAFSGVVLQPPGAPAVVLPPEKVLHLTPVAPVPGES